MPQRTQAHPRWILPFFPKSLTLGGKLQRLTRTDPEFVRAIDLLVTEHMMAKWPLKIDRLRQGRPRRSGSRSA